MSGSPVDITVVVPVYNCATWVLPKLDRIVAHFTEVGRPWELVVVDDGSADATASVVRTHLLGVPVGSLVRLPSNQGKGAAVLTGLRAGSGRYRLFMDCDLAYPLSEAMKLIAAVENGAAVAIASRRLPESVCELHPVLFRQVYSRYRYGVMLNAVVRFLGLTRCRDTQAGLKCLRTDVVDSLRGLTISRFAFDIELLHILERRNTRVVEVPVKYGYFDSETSVNIFRDGFQILREVIRIWRNSAAGLYDDPA